MAASSDAAIPCIDYLTSSAAVPRVIRFLDRFRAKLLAETGEGTSTVAVTHLIETSGTDFDVSFRQATDVTPVHLLERRLKRQKKNVRRGKISTTGSSSLHTIWRFTVCSQRGPSRAPSQRFQDVSER